MRRLQHNSALVELSGPISNGQASVLLVSPPRARSGTHILHNTRGNRLPMPVNGSLSDYDYVQPRAPGARLDHRRTGRLPQQNAPK